MERPTGAELRIRRQANLKTPYSPFPIPHSLFPKYMYRSNKPNTEDDSLGAGQDSFLDVVANIVGILIILTALVGARVQHVIAHPEIANAAEPVNGNEADSPAVEQTDSPVVDEELLARNSQLDKQLEQSASEASSLESHAIETKKTIALVEAQAEALNRTRQDIAYSTAAAKKEVEAKREKLSEAEKEKFDLQQKIAEKNAAIEELEKSIGYEMSQKKPDVKKLECYPTAISKQVDKSEVWIQLKKGRVACIPSEKLIDSFKQVVMSPGNTKTMWDGGKVTATVGPFDGFFLEGAAWKENTNASVDVRFIPVSEEVGETVDEAMESMESSFQKLLRKSNPASTVITVWVYEDSFVPFQEIEKYLYDSGYRVAARPLPNGVPIGAGPNGSRSAAQ